MRYFAIFYDFLTNFRIFLHFFDTVTLQKDEEKSEIRMSKSETNTNFQISKIQNKLATEAQRKFKHISATQMAGKFLSFGSTQDMVLS